MNPIFLKEQLLKNKSGIYSELVKKFYEPDISPSMLQSWIANELKVEENLINIKSLTSAINRYRKKNNLLQQNQNYINNTHKQQSVSDTLTNKSVSHYPDNLTNSKSEKKQPEPVEFKFSNPNDSQWGKKTGIQEL
ncbi:MAG: hypothetical protein C0459_11795 [Chitinophaga sp.]|jgi:hypothetical protein|nr:hypothetical protein [Chitinophaga sp.]